MMSTRIRSLSIQKGCDDFPLVVYEGEGPYGGGIRLDPRVRIITLAPMAAVQDLIVGW